MDSAFRVELIFYLGVVGFIQKASEKTVEISVYPYLIISTND